MTSVLLVKNIWYTPKQSLGYIEFAQHCIAMNVDNSRLWFCKTPLNRTEDEYDFINLCLIIKDIININYENVSDIKRHQGICKNLLQSRTWRLFAWKSLFISKFVVRLIQKCFKLHEFTVCLRVRHYQYPISIPRTSENTFTTIEGILARLVKTYYIEIHFC